MRRSVRDFWIDLKPQLTREGFGVKGMGLSVHNPRWDYTAEAAKQLHPFMAV